MRHIFLSSDVQYPPNNGAILSIAQIIRNVTSSASEAELRALYIVTRDNFGYPVFASCVVLTT